jgi:hypothetical protein
MSKLYKSAAVVGFVALLAGCEDDAAIASYNVSKAADNFEVTRKVVFYNGITGDYMLELVGRCSIEDSQGQLEVTCRTSPSTYVKHFLGLSDNVTYFVQQVEGVNVSVYHNRITWKPQSILPDIDLRGDVSELTTNRN